MVEYAMIDTVTTGALDLGGLPGSWDLLPSGAADLQRVLDAVNDRHRCVYDALADEYERKSETHVLTTLDRVKRVADCIESGSTILDVGCGVGLALSILSECGLQPTGIDVSQRMAELARQRCPRAKVIHKDFLACDFGTTTYDAIWEQAFLHLFPSVLEGLIFRRFCDLLNPGGVLSLSTTVSAVSREGWEVKTDYGPAPRRYRRFMTEFDVTGALDFYGFKLLDSWLATDPFGKKWLTVVGKKL
jgi:SAM-dependent methyltransferase